MYFYIFIYIYMAVIYGYIRMISPGVFFSMFDADPNIPGALDPDALRRCLDVD